MTALSAFMFNPADPISVVPCHHEWRTTLLITSKDASEISDINTLVTLFGRNGVIQCASPVRLEKGKPEDSVYSEAHSTCEDAHWGVLHEYLRHCIGPFVVIHYLSSTHALAALQATQSAIAGKFSAQLIETRCSFHEGSLPAWVPNREENSLQFQNWTLRIASEIPNATCSSIMSSSQVIIFVPSFAKIPSELRYLMDLTAVYTARFGTRFEHALFDYVKKKNVLSSVFRLFLDGNTEDLSAKSLNDDDDSAFPNLLSCSLKNANIHLNRIYFMWRTYSILNGGTLTTWRTAPFQMTQRGPIWMPPPLENNRLLVAQRPICSNLPTCERNYLIRLLRRATPTRGSVTLISRYILDRFPFMTEIFDILYDAINSKNASFVNKLARLYVLNDVLHNLKTTKDVSHLRNCIDPSYEKLMQVAIQMTKSAFEEYSNLRSRYSEFSCGVRYPVSPVELVELTFKTWAKASIISKEFYNEMLPIFSNFKAPLKG